MFKRATSIFLVLLVNFITLAHAVVSHHHHNSVVCITKEHCADETQNPINHSEKHKHDSSAQTCLLKQAIILPSQSQKLELKSIQCNEYQANYQFTLFKFYIQYSAFLAWNRVLHKPFIKSIYSNHISRSIGLRAPPTV